MRASLSESERTSTLLRLGIAEIDEVAPERGEDDALATGGGSGARARRGLRDAAVSARSLLSGQGEDIDTSSVISMISRAGSTSRRWPTSTIACASSGCACRTQPPRSPTSMPNSAITGATWMRIRRVGLGGERGGRLKALV